MSPLNRLPYAALASWWRVLLATVLLLLGLQAQAAPIGGGVLSGERGDFVTPTLADTELVAFEGADLVVTYDPQYLIFNQANAGAVIDNNSVVPGTISQLVSGLEQVQLSVAVGSGPVSGLNIDVLIALFQIAPTAPIGLTTINFLGDYYLVGFVDPFPVNLNVQVMVQAAATPELAEAGSAWLVLLALLALLAMRRKARPRTA